MCNQLLAMMFGQFLNTIANHHRKYSIITIYHNIDYGLKVFFHCYEFLMPRSQSLCLTGSKNLQEN